MSEAIERALSELLVNHAQDEAQQALIALLFNSRAFRVILIQGLAKAFEMQDSGEEVAKKSTPRTEDQVVKGLARLHQNLLAFGAIDADGEINSDKDRNYTYIAALWWLSFLNHTKHGDTGPLNIVKETMALNEKNGVSIFDNR